ncbi:hypothetical protein ABIE60_000373 [Marinobacterium sp. MBR-109]|jgi:hypothetical protein
MVTQAFFDAVQTSVNLTGTGSMPSIICNTPAMPLIEAHFGGFFVFGGQ